jgi:hypothetical protein
MLEKVAFHGYLDSFEAYNKKLICLDAKNKANSSIPTENNTF